MSDEINDARPVPLPPSVHDLIRQVKPEKGAAGGKERVISIDGREWVARVVGAGMAGSGAMGGAHFVAVRFQLGREKGGRKEPAREVLLPRGRFENLFDEELVELFHRARPVEGR